MILWDSIGMEWWVLGREKALRPWLYSIAILESILPIVLLHVDDYTSYLLHVLSFFPSFLNNLSLSLSIPLTFCCISLSRHTWISFFINTDLVLFTLTLRITLIYKRIHFLVLMSWFLSLSDKEETYSKWSNCITVNKILSSKRFSLLLKVIVRIQVNSKYLEEKKIFLFPFSPHLCCCCSLCSYLFDPNPWHSDRCFMAQKKEINMSAKVTEIYDLIFRYFSLDI